MPTPVEIAAAAAYRANRAAAGVRVTYQRAAGGPSLPLTAVPGRSESEHNDSDGMVTKVQSRDYLIAVADLVVGGAAVEPAPGDRVVEGSVAAGGRAYELMALPGVPCWQWSDPHRTVYRVHTKFVGLTPIGD